MIRAKALRPGSRVALVAPAGPLPDGGVERGVDRVHQLGWEPVVGRHARRRIGYLAGRDEERLADLMEAFTSTDNDAIWCLRGGYGTMRLLPHVDFEPLRKRPRPLIGFSDNTALHLAAHRAGLVTFHGPHAASAEIDPFSMEELQAVVSGERVGCALPLPASTSQAIPLIGGRAVGFLVGGNLSLIAATIGTPFEIQAAGAIFFLEEVGESAYRLDRLLTQLLMSGVLDGVAGVAVGAIGRNPADQADAVPPEVVIQDRLTQLGVPIAYGFPFGHVPVSWTLPLGIRARLDADAGTLELLEPPVSP